MSVINELFLESQEVKKKADCLFSKKEVYSAIGLLAQKISKTLADSNPIPLSATSILTLLFMFVIVTFTFRA